MYLGGATGLLEKTLPRRVGIAAAEQGLVRAEREALSELQEKLGILCARSLGEVLLTLKRPAPMRAASMKIGHISNCNAGGDQGRVQGAERGRRNDGARPVGRAEVRTRTDTSTLTLRVRTDDGDTVEISLAAQSQQTSGRASWRGAGGAAGATEQTSSSSLSAQVKVDGNLSDQEVADIQHLLESLSSGGQADNLADNSLAAYDYSQSRTHEVTRESVAVFA